MKLLQKILNKLNGLHYSQEYLCFARETFTSPLHVYLVSNSSIIKDITDQHLFVGYSPLIFAFSYFDPPASLQIILSQRVFQPNENFTPKDALAKLDLHLVKTQQPGSNHISYFEGTYGAHRFQTVFQQYIGKKYNEWFNQKQGNVFLHDNLYKQVQIAYSVPRQISLITVGSDGLYNMFPTDLHGQIDETYYIISLRTDGKACKQVVAEGKLLISDMHSHAYKMVYDSGKNHMQDLKPASNFSFNGSHAQKFSLPLPQMAIAYRELLLKDCFTLGIHSILLFKQVNFCPLQTNIETLVHLHNCYATWRYKNGLPGNYLMR